MEETRKRHENNVDGGFAEKRQRSVAAPDEKEGRMSDDILAWLSEDDETAGALMKILDRVKNESAAVKVKFTDDPYTTPLIFQSSSSSYVTINGNEESCGSSFADLDSSVMANVDRGEVNFARKQVMSVNLASGGEFPVRDGGKFGSDDEEARGSLDDDGGVGGGCNRHSIDDIDDGLAMFIGDGTLLK